MCRTCPLLHRTDICGVVQKLPRRVSVPQAQVRFLPPLLMKFTAMKILTLIIKQKWFDAILSGEKTVVIKRSQINFAPYNPRKEDPEVIKKLKKNFKTVGYLGGIVWNQLSSYLVSGHKRVQTLDIINNYDGTPETDYEIKVEAVELDDKTEREQNIFMNSPSAMGEFDMEKIKVLVPEIDYKAAGLSEADMNIYGISVMQDEISSELSDTLGDFEEIQRPFEERKAAVKEMKEQIRQQAEQKAEDIESYVMLNFKSYRAKSSFMLRFGFRPDDKIIPGEMFSDMVERVE